MNHNRLSGVIAAMAFACAYAIESDILHNGRREFDLSVYEPLTDLDFRRVIQRRDSPVWKLNDAQASDTVRLAKRYTELMKRAIDVSGLKIPLIGDYFRFLNIPTFGDYYKTLNLPYIPFLNIGQEPETTITFDIGPVNCTCKTKFCDCCLTAISVCGNIQGIPDVVGANISVSVFGFPLFNAPIPLLEKPSFCFTLITLFDTPFQLCIDLYDVNTLVVKNNACVTIGFQKGTERVFNLNVGCVEIGFSTFFSYKLPPNLDFFDIPVLGFKSR